jgi:hypothetical protein
MTRISILAALVLVLAGCAGDDGPSADEYREQATAICETATRDAAELERPEDDAASVAEYATAAAEIREIEAVALDALEPPGELEAEHRRLVNASGAIVRSLRDLAAAAEREDRAAAQASAAAGTQAATQARESASALELPRCGQPGLPQPR